MARTSPFIIPIFVSHEGCPHQCVFCNQHSITGCTERGLSPISAESVRQEIETRLALPRRGQGREAQVAFYGGSFTGMEKARQEELLSAVQPYIIRGEVQGVRLSTRPDYIDTAVADFLKGYGVTTVELGVQSMNDEVLAASGRGHSVAQSISSLALLKGKGFRVGAQLMIGLPKDTVRSAVAGAKRLAALAPDCVRIYPTVVVRGSGLAALHAAERFRPLALLNAVALTARLKEIFDRHAIPVIRMGLQASAGLERDLIAGPYHPAFGEMVLSRLFFKQVRAALTRKDNGEECILSVATADESIFRGQDNRNVERLQALGLLEKVRVKFDKDQVRDTISLTRACDTP